MYVGDFYCDFIEHMLLYMYICILTVLAKFYDMCNPEILCHCLFYSLFTCTLSEMMNHVDIIHPLLAGFSGENTNAYFNFMASFFTERSGKLSPTSWEATTYIIYRANTIAVDDQAKEVARLLTHQGRSKMADIFQTTFSNAFSWMKMFQLRL